MKQCRSCRKWKGLDSFWNSKRSRDGKDFCCSCCRTEQKLQRAATPFGLYSSRCRVLTNIFRPRWFPDQQPGEAVDHIFSIKGGFLEGLPIDVVCNRNNLRLITKTDNLKKASRSDRTKDDLLAGYIADEQLSRFAGMLEKIVDPATLIRWGVFVQLKNGGLPTTI